ncbi:nucleotide exchange factor GrpE [Streptomyces natalensis]|uniref:Protein GrpE n=1 Tax=Streptomyces natalensis ATCC 27448 TaxID=1240678 RepID=A0A0D7CK58_9ACTN|nr:nucleotide exchange factor GrpE [Streptomyces natalensis]KIZ16220.1 heat shock protein GrpE [Streptomyces natalensis ATCC 27448]
MTRRTDPPTGIRGLPRPPLSLVPDRPDDSPAVLPARTPQGRKSGDTDRVAPPGREPAAVQSVSPNAALRAELHERTADLQRVKAEYDNYRKRVRRDRRAVGEIAVANVLERLLPVLDAVAEAAEQGELTGGFRRVAEALEAELAALGLESVGRPGAPFDPTLHEAVTYTPADGGGGGPAAVPAPDRAVCGEVIRPGYRVGDRLLRPAQVAVRDEPMSDAPRSG